LKKSGDPQPWLGQAGSVQGIFYFLFLNFHFVFSKRNEVIWDIVTKKIGEIIKGLKYNILTL